MIRTGFEDDDVEKELLIASVMISCVNLIGNVYDLHKKAGALELSVGDYLKFIRRLGDGDNAFVKNTERRKETHEATKGLHQTMKSLERCKKIDGGLEDAMITLNDKGARSFMLSERATRRGCSRTSRTKTDRWRTSLSKYGRGTRMANFGIGALAGGEETKNKKVTAFLAYVEAEDKTARRSNTTLDPPALPLSSHSRDQSEKKSLVRNPSARAGPAVQDLKRTSRWLQSTRRAKTREEYSLAKSSCVEGLRTQCCEELRESSGLFHISELFIHPTLHRRPSTPS